MKINFLKLEKDLNNIKYNNVGIGSLLALEFMTLYKGNYEKKTIKNYLIFFKIVLRAFFTKVRVYPSKTILYYKSGDKNHHNYIFDVLTVVKKDIIITGGTGEAVIPSSVFKLNFKLLLYYSKWIFKNYNKFKKILTDNKQKDVQFSLFLDVIINILRVNYWNLFYKTNNIKILIGDYDRLNTSAPVYLTAFKNKIKSIVIQHGVINPPFGYTPLLANYVFVWGEMQKKQYISLGLEEKRIKVTGTPIISKVGVKKEQESKNKKNIVLAVNPIGDKYIAKQIQDFSELISVGNYNLYVKIHPSQTIENISKFINNKFIIILEKEINFDKFVALCDVLITHNSGLANECILNDIPVIILDNLPLLAGNGTELNIFCNVPIVNNAQGLIEKLDIIDIIDIKKKDLYYKSGIEAREEIYKEIFKLYNSVNENNKK